MKLDNSQKVLIFMQKHDPSFIICIYCLQAKAMETGFDNIFGEGPTPSHSAMAGERDMQQVKEKIRTERKWENLNFRRNCLLSKRWMGSVWATWMGWMFESFSYPSKFITQKTCTHVKKMVRETHHIVIAMQFFLHRQMFISFYVLSDKGFNA